LKSIVADLKHPRRRISLDPAASLKSVLDRDLDKWRKSLEAARASNDIADAHKFRTASKRLRYAIEVARELEIGADSAPVLKWLKTIQDGIGKLHDRAEMVRLASKALAKPKFLSKELRPASRALATLAREHDVIVGDTRTLVELFARAEQTESITRWVSGFPGSPKVADEPPRDSPPESNPHRAPDGTTFH
jgi:CHAD domain-containing protein